MPWPETDVWIGSYSFNFLAAPGRGGFSVEDLSFFKKKSFQLYQEGWISSVDLKYWASKKFEHDAGLIHTSRRRCFCFPSTFLVLIANFEVIEVKPYLGLGVWNRNGLRRPISKVPELSQLLRGRQSISGSPFRLPLRSTHADFTYFKMHCCAKI